jgi:hypothetical protein
MTKKVVWRGWPDKQDREMHEALPVGVRSRFKAEIEEALSSSNKVEFGFNSAIQEAEKLWRQSVRADFDALQAEHRKNTDEIDEAYKVLHEKRQALSELYQEKQNAILSTMYEFEPYKVARKEVAPKVEAVRAVKAQALANIRAKYQAKIVG